MSTNHPMLTSAVAGLTSGIVCGLLGFLPMLRDLVTRRP